MTDVRKLIASGGAVLGIEFGSTRIKGILINDKNEPIAEGSYEWENKLVDGVWTYDLETVWEGLRATYTSLAADVLQKYGVVIKKLAGIGISAMMHGYLAFDGENNLLVPFRTWRNTMTEQASEELTELFNYNIPQR
ncbi:MAG: FGGY family carbohydrate kinase, partial [Lachnospiraceae bacterium]|nr:FGGY family carbohydrate kinase [Lachnospiraceae bacterium]